MEGAAQDPRTVDGAPFLNAYEALRAAAQRPGAPLCGSRVWSEAGQIYAERMTGLEALGPPEPEYAPFGVAPIHGGKFIRYQTSQGVKALRWGIEGGTTVWEASGLPTGYLRGGTDASVHGFSHDQDTIAIFNSSAVNGTSWWHSSVSEDALIEGHEVDSGTGSLVNPWQIGTLTIDYDPQPVRSLCIERFTSGGCTINVSENRFWIFRLGYPQNGLDAYLTVSPLEVVPMDSTEWQTCSFDAGRDCRQIRMDQKHLGTRVFRIAPPSGEPEPVSELPDGGAIYWIGQSEAAAALVLGRGEWNIHSWYDAEHFRATGNIVRVREGNIVTCAIEYRDASAFLLVRDPIATQNACNLQDLDYPSEAGGGTISSSRGSGEGLFWESSSSQTLSLVAGVVAFTGTAFEEIR